MNNNSQNFAPPLILNDSPAEELFCDFQFEAYIEALFDRLISKENNTPLTISIEGDWGSGKTTVMQHLKKKLDDNRNSNYIQSNNNFFVKFKNRIIKIIKRHKIKQEVPQKVEYRICHTVWFQVWKYKEQDQILSALIQEIITAMRQDSQFKAIIAAILKNKTLKNVFKNIFTSISYSGFAPFANWEPSEHQQNLAYYYHFQNFLKLLIKLFTHRIDKKNFIKAIRDVSILLNALNCKNGNKSNDIVVIFIDDLDRCPKDKILQVLESVKLFLDFPGCAVVMGISPAIINNALSETPNPSSYLEKIFQIRCELPIFHKNQLTSYINSIIYSHELFKSYNIPDSLNLAETVATVTVTPRQCKQLLNNISLSFFLLKRKNLIKQEADKYLSYTIKNFKKNNRYLYKLLVLSNENSISNIRVFLNDDKFKKDEDFLLMKLETLCEAFPGLKGELIAFEKETKFNKTTFQEDISYSHFLAFYLIKEAISHCEIDNNSEGVIEPSDFHCLNDIDFWQNLQYSYIDDRLIVNEKHKKNIISLKEQIPIIHSLILELPADENNIKLLIYQGLNVIPTLTQANIYYDVKVNINTKFLIDKYPVTNKRFVEFLNKIQMNESVKQINEYIHFHYSKILKSGENEYLIQSGYENHPVTGVTWEGANRFAEENGLMLPTVDQWCEAFGTNKYPYGDDFDASKCNTIESNLMDTTPVDQYPSGMSPKNVFDMTGNVWEWCLDKDEKTGYRVIKGGSWANRKEDATQVSQEIYPPNKGMATIGFRCVSLILR